MSYRKPFDVPPADELDKSSSDHNKPAGSLFQAHQKSIRGNIEQTQPSSGNNTSASKLPASSTHVSGQESQTFKNVLSSESGQITVNGAKSQSSAQNSDTSDPVVPSKAGKGNALVVSNRQRSNPVLKHIRNVAWEFGDIVPDYQMGLTNCALFLSLRYHNLKPDYIHQRLKQLGHSYTLRVVLVLVDVKDPHHILKELAGICILSDCTLILAFTAEEAGRYLETYKAFENKPPDLIMEKTEGNYLGRFTDVLTAARRVNKTDAATLISTFGTFENLVKASEEDLSLCSGFGPQKAQRVFSIMREPFLKSRKRPKTPEKVSTKTDKKTKKS